MEIDDLAAKVDLILDWVSTQQGKESDKEDDEVQALRQELESRPSPESYKEITDKAEDLSFRYKRLMELLSHGGSSVGDMIDSKAVYDRLMTTDDDVSEIVQDWHKKHPSRVESALKSGSAPDNISLNDLFHSLK